MDVMRVFFVACNRCGEEYDYSRKSFESGGFSETSEEGDGICLKCSGANEEEEKR